MKITNQAEYDAAKKTLEIPHVDFIMNAQGLRDQMLEYRHQNGFFEVGDWVVSTLYGSGDNVFQFESWLVDFMDCIRHANDAEIEANRRLDLPESVVLSLREVS